MLDLTLPPDSTEVAVTSNSITSEGHVTTTSRRVLFLAANAVAIGAGFHGFVIAATPVFNHATTSREIDWFFCINSFYWLQLTPLQ
ncbi:MAG: hypothetical protein U1E01_10285, partial [Methylicorpusculum sp.]|nr:hypothetical protein [Methylicorpusculum sp.]